MQEFWRPEAEMQEMSEIKKLVAELEQVNKNAPLLKEYKVRAFEIPPFWDEEDAFIALAKHVQRMVLENRLEEARFNKDEGRIEYLTKQLGELEVVHGKITEEQKNG